MLLLVSDAISHLACSLPRNGCLLVGCTAASSPNCSFSLLLLSFRYAYGKGIGNRDDFMPANEIVTATGKSEALLLAEQRNLAKRNFSDARVVAYADGSRPLRFSMISCVRSEQNLIMTRPGFYSLLLPA